MAIPKIIHYCWFGGKEKPKFAQKCIQSWRKHCPDYQIKEWNESNFDFNCNEYVKQAYNAGKWAFVADVARLKALETDGGFYMDTDVELVKPLDELLSYSACFGFESKEFVMTGFFGAEKGANIIKVFLNIYEGLHFIKEDGSFDLTTNVVRLTELLVAQGLQQDGTRQTVGENEIFPSEYFSPKDFRSGILSKTENTLAIHHFDASWQSKEAKKRKKNRWKALQKEEKKVRRKQRIKKILYAVFGEKLFNKLRRRK